jgi:hypothetical protein
MAATLTLPPFVMTEADAYASTVSQPLTPAAGRPIDMKQDVERINHKVYQGLIDNHNRNVVEGYFQSHPFDQIYTAQALAVDQATLSSNYMRCIFGGQEDPAKDALHMAYTKAQLARAEAPTGRVLYELGQADFVEGAQATKDSLLETFAQTRRFFKGQIDTDAERFMKNRADHGITQVTFYGKNVDEAGGAGRFHRTAGQHGHLQYRPDTTGMPGWWGLSSKTWAPDGSGGEVPLIIAATDASSDPRQVPLTSELRVAVGDPVRTFNMNDAGSYPGRDVDRFVRDYTENNPQFEDIFRDTAQRRYV